MTGPVTLLAGGKGGDPDAMQRALGALVKQLGARPAVAYVGAANGDSPRFLGWMEPALRDAGAGEVTHVKTVGEWNSRAAKRTLEQAGLVFVGGGDVEEGMRVLQKRKLVPVLRELHISGMAFCGVSAGSIMLAKDWVRWRDPDAAYTFSGGHTGSFRPTLFPQVYERFARHIAQHEAFIVTGLVTEDYGAVTVEVQRVDPLRCL